MSLPTTGSQPQAAPASARAVGVPLGCKDCGHTFTEADGGCVRRCPHCGSTRIHLGSRRVGGMLLPEDAAPHDDCFARLALWGDVITSKQFADCVEEQRAFAEADEPVPTLATLLVRKGYIRREHADAVLRATTTRTPEEWRHQFGQIALREGHVTEAQLREGLELQTRLIMGTGSAPFLGHILIERGYMTEAQVLAILKVQEEHHIGLLHDLQALLRPGERRSVRFVRRHLRAVRALAFAAAVGVAGLVGAWLYSLAAAPPAFELLCDRCGHHSAAPASAVGRACPRCGGGEMCTSLWCSKCRVAFPLKVRARKGGVSWVGACPVCGTLDHVELPPGMEGLAANSTARNTRAETITESR